MANKLILYGCGNIGIEWLDRLGGENVYAFADSNHQKWGKRIRGKGILSTDEIISLKDDIVIFISTSYEYKEEIYQFLVSKHLENQVVGYPVPEISVSIDLTSYIDAGTILEGRNALHSGGQLYGCSVGFASYISTNTILQNVKIGRYTSIGPNVRVIRGQHPTREFVSTHPIFYSTRQIIKKSYVSENLFDEFRYTKDGWTIEIGNDVWIGEGVMLMEGISIANGTIIAAGSNVVKDTEPYSIVGGNPARVIRYRFGKDDISFLQEIKWWDLGEKWIDEHAKYFDDIRKLRQSQEYNSEKERD